MIKVNISAEVGIWGKEIVDIDITEIARIETREDIKNCLLERQWNALVSGENTRTVFRQTTVSRRSGEGELEIEPRIVEVYTRGDHIGGLKINGDGTKPELLSGIPAISDVFIWR
ncbi:hypothetical protein KAU51_01655 [Candidatus Parcubacteria bacterium]|nr:hypothetical protein [Candidatus Parcubacteria bacterium]